MDIRHKKKSKWTKRLLSDLTLSLIALGIFVFSTLVIWVSTIDLPDFNNFENRSVANSTKIYDRTGKIVLYNIHDNVRRTEVSLEEISPYIRQATISIEDSHFYEHNGIRILSILRAAFANLQNAGFAQGGSTITQQVVKNALLTREKTITRKIKEIVLSLKLDAELPKDSILSIYLNENPYGGTIYGVEEASLSYFNKHAKDVDIAEAAYLAAMPQAPTYFSPYGKHRDELDKRKNIVIDRMFELGYITEKEKTSAQKEIVSFGSPEDNNGKALHFVFYVREYLEQKYGKDMVENGGLKVITTLDYDLQKKMEEVVKVGAFENEKKFKASNAGLIANDPRTGQILSMVGSRDFFDTKIQGQYNVTTALRQPGSSFKPIVYSAALEKGYTPETVLFDSKTQFSTACDAYGVPYGTASTSVCYSPENYDGVFRGPVTLRNALAQSLNVPAVKLLYLVGIDTAIKNAQAMGLSTIQDASRYGLSLVLGGGEVTLVELANAYGVFANNGVYSKPMSVLEVDDSDGTILEKNNPSQTSALSENTSSLISSILSDTEAKIPAYGANSKLFFGDRPVASKTGTTNDYKDVWIIGYTPSIVVGMWAGNNDNTPIDKKVAGMVVVPVWRNAMDVILKDKQIEYFPDPIPNTSTKPILSGVWCENGTAHTILNSVIKDDPNGSYPSNPYNDSQFKSWETSIQLWLQTHSNSCTGGVVTNSSSNTSTQSNIIPETTVEIPTTVVN